MKKNVRRDAFGVAATRVRKIPRQSPDSKLYAMLCLQPSGKPENALWLSQVKRATDWNFHTNHFCLDLHKNGQHNFPVYYSKRPGKKMVILISNLSENGEQRLLSYGGNACCHISVPNAKVLPNQLSLFEEEPEEVLSAEDEAYENNNPYDISIWNETSAYLERHSQPLTEFSWLLPVNYFNCEYLRPFLHHLERIPGLNYRFLPHEMIEDVDLIMEIKACEETLYTQLFPDRRY